MAAIIKKCNCKSEFQDKKYGKNNRVYNTSKEEKEANCTVCGKNIRA